MILVISVTAKPHMKQTTHVTMTTNENKRTDK